MSTITPKNINLYSSTKEIWNYLNKVACYIAPEWGRPALDMIGLAKENLLVTVPAKASLLERFFAPLIKGSFERKVLQAAKTVIGDFSQTKEETEELKNFDDLLNSPYSSKSLEHPKLSFFSSSNDIYKAAFASQIRALEIIKSDESNTKQDRILFIKNSPIENFRSSKKSQLSTWQKVCYWIYSIFAGSIEDRINKISNQCFKDLLRTAKFNKKRSLKPIPQERTSPQKLQEPKILSDRELSFYHGKNEETFYNYFRSLQPTGKETKAAIILDKMEAFIAARPEVREEIRSAAFGVINELPKIQVCNLDSDDPAPPKVFDPNILEEL